MCPTLQAYEIFGYLLMNAVTGNCPDIGWLGPARELDARDGRFDMRHQGIDLLFIGFL